MFYIKLPIPFKHVTASLYMLQLSCSHYNLDIAPNAIPTTSSEPRPTHTEIEKKERLELLIVKVHPTTYNHGLSRFATGQEVCEYLQAHVGHA